VGFGGQADLINAEYFRSRLPVDVAAKATESADQPSLEIHLTDGSFYRVQAIVETNDAWIVLEIYPHALKKHDKEDRQAGAPPYKLESTGTRTSICATAFGNN
jgi:hypothetical protein